MGTCQSDNVNPNKGKYHFQSSANNDGETLKSQQNGDELRVNEEFEKAVCILKYKNILIQNVIKVGQNDALVIANDNKRNYRYTVKIVFLRPTDKSTKGYDQILENIKNEQAFQILMQELTAVRQYQHQNILRIDDIFRVENICFIFMEECQNSLEQYLQSKSQLSEEDIILIGSQLIEGMEYIHSQNFHVGEMNFQNILLNSFGHVKYIGLRMKNKGVDEQQNAKSLQQSIDRPCMSALINQVSQDIQDKVQESILPSPATLYRHQSNDVQALAILFYLLARQSLELLRNQDFQGKKLSSYKDCENISQEFNNLIKSIIFCDQKNIPTIADVKYQFSRSIIIRNGQKSANEIENYMSNQDSGISQPKIFRTQNKRELDPRYSIDTRGDKLLLHQEILPLYKQSQQQQSSSNLLLHLQPIDIDPIDKISCNNLGILYQKELKHFQVAEDYFRKALEIDSQYVPAIINLANLYIQDESKLQEAEEQLVNVIQLDQYNVDAHIGLGQIYFQRKQWQIAYNHFNIAHHIDQHNYKAIFSIAIVLEECKNFKEASISYQSAIYIDPNQKFSYIKLAELQFIYLDQEKQALENLKKALTLDQNDNIIQLYQGILQNEISEFEEVSEYLDSSILKADISKYYLKAGILFHKYQHNYQQAKLCFEESIELEESSSQTYNRAVWYLADTLQNLNNEKHKLIQKQSIPLTSSTDLDD